MCRSRPLSPFRLNQLRGGGKLDGDHVTPVIAKNFLTPPLRTLWHAEEFGGIKVAKQFDAVRCMSE